MNHTLSSRPMSTRYTFLPNPITPSPNSNPNPNPNLINTTHNLTFFPLSSRRKNLTLISSAGDSHYQPKPSKSPPLDLVRTLAAASAILIFGLGIRASSASPQFSPLFVPALVNHHSVQGEGLGENDNVENYEEEEMWAAFEKLKSKTYSLTVPLKIIALRNSVPPLWIKNFIQSQGRRVKFRLEFRGNIEDIYSELSSAFSQGIVVHKSAAAADIVSVGDTWVSSAINKALIEPIQGVEDQDWFSKLPDKWKVYLRRNDKGRLESDGHVYAAPYRWGSMVIAYRKNYFRKHKLAPIEDWADLWRTDLARKISMVDSPREVVGAVLKYMGASYNTTNIDSEIPGGRNSVQDNLAKLRKQVRLFDSTNYLKAFNVGDVCVAVGWSSDILPMAKRMSDVAVIVPKSGASLWADLWAVPAVSSIVTDKNGGRVRGPSPLVHQWIEFCLQTERAPPFEKEVIPGASPSALEKGPLKPLAEPKNQPKLQTNLIAGVPPPDILSRCEFLEPLSESALSDYQWLIDSIQKPSQGDGMIRKLQGHVLSVIQTFMPKPSSRVS